MANKKALYEVTDTKTGEVRIMTATEISERYNISRQYIGEAATKNFPIKGMCYIKRHTEKRPYNYRAKYKEETALKLAITSEPYEFKGTRMILHYGSTGNLINTTFLEGLWVTVTACLGVFLIAVAVEGYVYAPVNMVLRVLCAVGSGCLIFSGWRTDLIGFVILVILIFAQRKKAKNLAQVKAI